MLSEEQRQRAALNKARALRLREERQLASQRSVECDPHAAGG